jgi:hypothetical protein
MVYLDKCWKPCIVGLRRNTNDCCPCFYYGASTPTMVPKLKLFSTPTMMMSLMTVMEVSGLQQMCWGAKDVCIDCALANRLGFFYQALRKMALDGNSLVDIKHKNAMLNETHLYKLLRCLLQDRLDKPISVNPAWLFFRSHDDRKTIDAMLYVDNHWHPCIAGLSKDENNCSPCFYYGAPSPRMVHQSSLFVDSVVKVGLRPDLLGSWSKHHKCVKLPFVP